MSYSHRLYLFTKVISGKVILHEQINFFDHVSRNKIRCLASSYVRSDVILQANF